MGVLASAGLYLPLCGQQPIPRNSMSVVKSKYLTLNSLPKYLIVINLRPLGGLYVAMVLRELRRFSMFPGRGSRVQSAR